MSDHATPNFDSDKVEIKDLADDIAAVADVRRLMLRYEEDIRFEKQGGTVFYAVDTDILYMHLSPEDRARYAYSRVFRQDDDDQTGFLSGVLSSFIFNHLPNTSKESGGHGWRPLLLLPGHDAEVRRYYDRVVASVVTGAARGAQADRRLREYMEQVERAHTDSEIKALIDDSPVQELFQVAEPAAQAKLLKRLVQQNSIQSLEKAATHPAFDLLAKSLTGKLSDLRAPRTVKQMVDFASLNRSWLQALGKYRHRPKGLASDAQALARLEQINRDLEHAEARVRLVLITGAPTIHAATEACTLASHNMSFADRYVRAPLSFLGAPEIIKPLLQRSGDEVVHDWIDAYLAEFFPDGEPEFDTLAVLARRDDAASKRRRLRSAKRAIMNDADARRERFKRWSEHVGHLKAAHGSVSSIAQTELQARLGSKLNEYDTTSLSQVRELLSDELRKSWAAFFEIAALLGFEFLLKTDLEMRFYRRTVPPVVLHGYPELQRFADLASQRTLHHHIDPSAIKEVFGPDCETLEDVLDTVNAREPTGYLSTLLMALLFAYADRTYTAATLAERAIEIFKKTKETKPDIQVSRTDVVPVTGREAYYLFAALTRALAENEEQLDLAEAALDAFNKSQSDTPGYEFTGLRNDAEAVLIETSRIFICVFDKAADMQSTRAAHEAIPQLIDRLHTVSKSATQCSQPTVCSVTQRRLATYGVTTLALAFYLRIDIERFGDALNFWRQTLEGAVAAENDKSTRESGLSFLTHCAALRSAGSFGTWDLRGMQSRKQFISRDLLKSVFSENRDKIAMTEIEARLIELLLR